MGAPEALIQEVESILKGTWSVRQGTALPTTESIGLGKEAVELEATVLYSDLADSTGLVKGYKNWFAAEVFKAFTLCVCKVIRAQGGDITSFDGDRVMGVFLGDSKNTNAAIAALKINWAVRNAINPTIKKLYPNTGYEARHATGVDTGKLFVARTGVRGDNDLVWVGTAANISAKLCSLREGNYSSFVTAEVFGRLQAHALSGGSPKREMWEKANWKEYGATVYRSNWWWAP